MFVYSSAKGSFQGIGRIALEEIDDALVIFYHATRQRIYAQFPAKFVKRLEAYWTVSRS